MSQLTFVEAALVYRELSNYLEEYIPNRFKCLCIKKVRGEIFEVQIFCANVHKGECKERSFMPHYWPCANPKVTICNFDQVLLAQVLQFFKNQAELCKTIFGQTQELQADLAV
jgi:hypothetical protein